MDKEQVTQTIINLCDGEDGFLVKLHSLRTFDKDKYTSLVNAIKTYSKIIRNDEYINKVVAGSFCNLILTLSNVRDNFPRNEAEKRLIEDAIAECCDLISEMFTPNSIK